MFKTELNTILALSQREIVKFLRNKPRMLLHIGLPVVLVWIIGGGFEFGLNRSSDLFEFNYMKFIFAGVIAQNAFQSTAVGLISFVEERKNGFNQTLFVAPISLFTIIIGKICGEICVAFIQVFFLILFLPFFNITDFTIWDILFTFPITLISGFLGGAFGIFVLSNIKDVKTASQIAPITIGLQFFLAGVLQPIKYLPNPQLFLSRLMPMTYVVDFSRSIIFWTNPEAKEFVMYSSVLSMCIIGLLFSFFLFFGIWNFIRSEKDK